MIPTNQFQLQFNHQAIAQKFVILEAKRDSGNYYHSLIPDFALQIGHALAVAYDWGNCCYILYDRTKTDRDLIKSVLEKEEGDVRIQEISSVILEQNCAHLLAQLLCNAMPALGADGRMYHNLTGKFYYHDPAWQRGRPGALRYFWTLRIEIIWDKCIKLSVVTFRAAERSPKNQGEPQYLFDTQSYSLRRLVRQDPDRNTPRFVIGSWERSRKNTVPFLEFNSLEEFQRCKVGVLQKFLEDVGQVLSPYLTMTIQYLEETTHIGTSTTGNQIENMLPRLREAPVYVEDTVQDDSSRALISSLRRELKIYGGIPLLEGKPESGDTLFRVVHNKDFYEDCPEQDPYQEAPDYCAVQHITVEDFRLDEKTYDAARDKMDPPLRKVLQELAIKRDVRHGKMTCFDWPQLGYVLPVNFVIIPDEYRGKDAILHYRRLQVLPDGTLKYSQWRDRPFWEDTEQEKIAAAFQNQKGKIDNSVEGVIYQDPDDIQIIRKTERYTLPDMTKLQNLLSQTRDTEWLDVAPLKEVVYSLIPDARPQEQEAITKIYQNLSECPLRATRKQLRACLNLRTAVGREVNKKIFDRTEVLIGSGLKQKNTMEQLLGGTLYIRLFDKANVQYYYSGYRGNSLQSSLKRACRIRKVSSTGGMPDFGKYLSLMEVDFVRASGWTVLPFPFKYLREWKPE